MQADIPLVVYITTTYYNLTPITESIKPLCGYNDKNFLVTDSGDQKTYVLKIVNRDESCKQVTDIVDEIYDNAYNYCKIDSLTRDSPSQVLSFFVPRLVRTTGDKLSTFTSVRYEKERANSAHDELPFETVKCNIKLFEYFDGITLFDYINRKGDANKLVDKLYLKLGRACHELFVFLRTQVHLVERLKSARGESFPWQLKTCEPNLRELLGHLYPNKNHVRYVQVDRVLSEFKAKIKPKLDQLPEYILHSDLCNKNILIQWEPDSQHKDRFCLIDFQDLQVGQQVIEVAVLLLYSVVEKTQIPFRQALKIIPRWIISGYQMNASCSLTLDELHLVPGLMKLRLCQSLLNGQLAFEKDPKNSYVMETNQRGWELLEIMLEQRADELVASWLEE